jgi:hypothetical protein
MIFYGVTILAMTMMTLAIPTDCQVLFTMEPKMLLSQR